MLIKGKLKYMLQKNRWKIKISDLIEINMEILSAKVLKLVIIKVLL